MEKTMKLQTFTMLMAIVMTLLMSLLLTGCGEKRPDGMPPLTPCELTVTQENAPLIGATVSLIPADGMAKWNIVSITDEKGIAKIMTNGQYNGVPEGNYKIIIMKIEEEAKTGPAVPKPGEPGYDEAVANLGNKPSAKRYFLIDKKFTNPASTPLSIEIKGTAPLKQNLDAGKTVRIAL